MGGEKNKSSGKRILCSVFREEGGEKKQRREMSRGEQEMVEKCA